MYQSILIPIAEDVASKTDQALEVARALRSAGGKITLLHVLETIPSYALAYIPEEIRSSRAAKAREMLDAVAERAGGGVEVAVEQGHGGHAIVEHAEKSDTDCIVIMSHKPELQDIFFGSTAAEVVRHAACCVHVLR